MFVGARVSEQTVDRERGIAGFGLTGLDGGAIDSSKLAGRAVLVVNVASKCGHTPQYAGLQALYETYRGRGLTVLGVPCNQFLGQEPGTAEEIAEFCSASYGVTFPLTQKLDVNGPDRHPLYAWLSETPDAEGEAGDVKWNFEKFLVSPDGRVVRRFRPKTLPESDEIRTAIDTVLPE
jgi:glutathione peroxidase